VQHTILFNKIVACIVTAYNPVLFIHRPNKCVALSLLAEWLFQGCGDISQHVGNGLLYDGIAVVRLVLVLAGVPGDRGDCFLCIKAMRLTFRVVDSDLCRLTCCRFIYFLVARSPSFVIQLIR
jgi:hypothetical protein